MTTTSFKKLFPAALKLGTLLGLALCLFFLWGIFQRPEQVSLDARYRLRGEVDPHPAIVIIGITNRCLNQLGKFPWPRTYHADLIDFLKKSGAKVIAMDIFFSQPDADLLIDQRLAEAINKAGNVILPVFMPYRILGLEPGENFIHVENLIESTAGIAASAASQGHINILPDSDGVCRKAALAVEYSAQTFFSLGAEAALKFLKVAPADIGWSTDYLAIKDKQIPLEDSKFVYMNFADIEGKSPRFAFSDVLRGLVSPDNFKNKLVFVGQTTQGLPNADILQTPFKEKYGVTMQANIANTFLNDFYFKRVKRARTCAWIIFLCIATCAVMICMRTWLSSMLVLAEFSALCWLALTAFIQKGVIVEFVPMALAIGAGFTGAILYRIRFADMLVETRELALESILQAGMIAADGLKAQRPHDIIMGTVISSVGARGLLLRWKNEKTSSYEKQYAYGSAQIILKGPMLDAEEKLADSAINSRKAILIRDITKDPLFKSKAGRAGVHSVLCAPLLLKGEVAGTLTLFDKLVSGHPQEIYFDEEDLKLFLILTQQTAISLESVRLFEEVNELFLNSIKSLAETIDAKDPYTHGHSERVTSDAVAIAEEMGLTEEEKRDIMVAAILHDVGKIGVKDVILSKPAPLTAEEKTIFDQHPDIGSKIMSPIEQLEKMIPIIRHHHESYDGSGYPDKLKGEQIPLGARIISVADTFDAMTSDRPYRKALSSDTAKQEINKLAAKQFDPQVVNAFNKVLEKGRIKTA